MRKNRRNKNKRFRLLLVLIFFVIGAVLLFKPSNIEALDTTKPTKTEYLDKYDTDAYLILNEKVYTSQGDGVVDYNVRDGERVPKDFVVANLSLMNDVSNLKEELLKVQSAIEYKNQNLNPSTSTYEITDKEVNLINSIQDSLVQEDIVGALVAIETLELNTKKNVDISEISSLINLSNQELEDKRDSLSKEISTNNVVYKSEIAGIVSYKVDKLEEVFTVENIPKMDFAFIQENKNISTLGQRNSVKTGDPLYKLIDNFSYYLAIPVEQTSFLRTLKKDDSIELLINSKVGMSGIVERTNKTKDKGVIIVKLKEKLSELGYDRKVAASIVKNRLDCYVIPTKSIVEIKSQLGVYVIELNGIVKFRPVEILSQNEVDTVVSVGDENGMIKNMAGKNVKTITAFDDIVNEPANIEEGDILE